MIWVVDASVAVRWYLEEEVHPLAERVLERIIDEPGRFAVPELFPFEVYAVLQRLHPDGLRTFCQGVIPLIQSGMLRHPMTEGLAVKANRFVAMGLTGYDACYATLALDLKGCWLTFDKQAHQAIHDEELSCLLSERLPKHW